MTSVACSSRRFSHSNSVHEPEATPLGFHAPLALTLAIRNTKTTCREAALHSMRKACTGSIEAARCAGMMPAMAAATTSTPIAMIITGTFTLLMS